MTTDITVDAQADELAGLLETARALTTAVDLHSTVVVVIERLLAAFPCDAVGVLLIENGHAGPAGASHPLAERADEFQVRHAEGPGLAAIGRGGEVVVDDLRSEHRWPAWSPQAVGLGWNSVVSISLTGAKRSFGAVNLYSHGPGFGRHDRSTGHVVAAQAVIALAGAVERESLLKAVDARHVIGQAQGILMERYDIDAEQAFTVLRRYSSHTNRKLRLVAEEIVRSRRLPPPEGGSR